MAIELISTSTQVDYDPNRPVTETIKAIGKFAVTSASAACVGAELTRDFFVLGRIYAKESIVLADISTRISTRRAEIAGLTELHALELEYAETLAKLQGGANA